MNGQGLSKEDYARINRVMFLLLNRAMMYKADHPHIKDAIGNLHRELSSLPPDSGNLVLLLNRDQLFLDEEPVDPRINTGRIVALFKKARVQSISFDEGIAAEEFQALIDILTAPQTFGDCDKMAAELDSRGVRHVRINHVFYKKITRDDEVISRRDAQAAASPVAGQSEPAFSKQLMKRVMDSILAEDAATALSMKNLLADPTGLSRAMLDAEDRSRDAAADGGAGQAGEDAGEMAPGSALLYQLQALQDDVDRQMEAGDPVNMMDVADAVCEMKRQLSIGIESQKALNQAFANEEQILNQMDELTDSVIIKLIRSEYQQGKITTVRMAQILRRLVPEAGGLKRLLPKIKAALLAEGMPAADYMELVRQLGRELENEGLARILQEAAESVGVEGDELIDEIRRNPQRAAELMAIAAEIRKGTGDENGFTEMLINYVERLGVKIREDATADGDNESAARNMMADVGSGLIGQLKKMNFSNQALLGMEERINARIEEVCGKLTSGGPRLSPIVSESPRKEKTLLQMMEQSVEGNEELKGFLRLIRARADAGEIDENSFAQIYPELIKQDRASREQEAKRQLPEGVLKSEELKFYLEKELMRAKRHNLHLSALPFSILKARLQEPKKADRQVEKTDVLNAAYRRLVEVTRASDIIGELGRDTITMVLPMTDKARAELALKRISKLLHDHVFEINGVRLRLVIAGSVAAYLPEMKPNVESFIKTIGYELEHVVSRMKYVHRLT